MKQTVSGTAGGSVQAVASKSWLQRALICAALADGRTDIAFRGDSRDVTATERCLRALGAEVAHTRFGFSVCGGLTAKTAEPFCDESGATLRLLLPVAAAFGISADFYCAPQLKSRPMEPLCTALAAHGCEVRQMDFGWRTAGKLQAGDYQISGSLSSQFLSGLLLALPNLVDDSKIMLTDEIASAPYVALTRAVQSRFGVETEKNNSELPTFSVRGSQHYQAAGKLSAEGDWSNAAPFLCAGAFSDSGVTVTGLPMDSLQGDRAIVGLLSHFGAEVSTDSDAVRVRRGSLHGLHIDATDIPDLVPLLALLGSCAEGETVITGAARLRVKESDRLLTTVQTLRALGADAEITPDGLRLSGNSKLHGGSVSACGDHRIAMLAAVACFACGEAVCIDGAEAVNKSYPWFFEDFKRICR